MDVKRFHLRSRAMLVMLAAAFALLLWTLFDLQVVNGSYYLEQSTRKIANTETVQAARGAILDRYGRALVSNRATYQVTLDLQMMGSTQNRNETILALLQVCEEQGVEWTDTLPVTQAAPFHYTVDSPYTVVTLGEDGTESRTATRLSRLVDSLKLWTQKKAPLPQDPSAAELIWSLRTWFEVDESVPEAEGRALVGVLYELFLRSRDIYKGSGYIFAQDVDVNFITVVKERRLIGVRIDTATVREYNTKYAAHLLGQVGAIQNWDSYKDKGYSMNDTVGVDGVERAFEEILRGTSGVKDVDYNQNGKIVSESWHVDPETGEFYTGK